MACPILLGGHKNTLRHLIEIDCRATQWTRLAMTLPTLTLAIACYYFMTYFYAPVSTIVSGVL